MSEQKRLLLISQYFYPEQFRVNDLCSAWVNRGYDVTVLTGIPNYPQGKFYQGYHWFKKRRENWNGMRIIRLPIIPRGNNNIMLGLNFLSFVVSGFFWSIFSKLKPDLIFIYEVSPMTQALPGIWFAKRRMIPCYLYILDLWPENVEIVAGIKNGFIISLINKMVDYIYRHCSSIFTASRGAAKAIQDRGVSKERIKYWPQYAEAFYQPINPHIADVPEIEDGILTMVFAGNVGFAQGLDVLPQAAELLREKDIVFKFIIVGDGRYKQSLVKIVNEKEVSNCFQFIPRQPAERIPAIMSVCDAALITLSKSKVFETTIPAKLQSVLACGIPIIVCADGEIQQIVNESKAGLFCEAGDAHMLASIIVSFYQMSEEERKQMKSNAIQYSREHFNKESLLDQMDNYFMK